MKVDGLENGGDSDAKVSWLLSVGEDDGSGLEVTSFDADGHETGCHDFRRLAYAFLFDCLEDGPEGVPALELAEQVFQELANAARAALDDPERQFWNFHDFLGYGHGMIRYARPKPLDEPAAGSPRG